MPAFPTRLLSCLWPALAVACVIPPVPDGADDTTTDPVDTPEDPVDTPDVPFEPWSLDETIPSGIMPEDSLFRIDRVVEIRLTLSLQAHSALQGDPRSYVPATMRIYGQDFEVGIRTKGSSTWQSIDQKPSLKVAMDFSVPGQEIFGYEGFNLHNCGADPSYMGEAVGHRMMRLGGVPSLRVGYARVTIDGQDRGLYTIVQRKDHDWMREWFSDPEGSLYEAVGCDFNAGAGCWDMDHQGDGDTRQDLVQFTNAMAQNGQAWWNTFRTQMDSPRVIRGLAAEWVIGHWDSYSGNLNNYHLYHEPTTDLWSLSPWSLDLSFSRPVAGNCHGYGINKAFYDRGLIAQRCHGDATCDQELDDAADALMTAIEAYDVTDLFDRIQRVIEPEVQTDPFGPGMASFRREWQCAQSYLTERRPELHLRP